MAHDSHGFDWDDLKHLLAVARHGSTLRGRALKIDQSTVQRRLAELERRIGQALVQRHPTGYRLTAFGQEMLPTPSASSRRCSRSNSSCRPFGAEVAGVIRMTCPEPLVYRITQTALLDRFHALHPALRVQFVTSDKYLDLSKGEADVALRSGDTDDNELVGRKIGDSIWAVYASRTYIERHGRPSASRIWRNTRWSDSTRAWQAPRLRMAATGGAGHAAGGAQQQRAGLIYSVKAGSAWRRCHRAGDAQPDLVRVLGPVPELTRIWRLLTTPSCAGRHV